MSAADWPQVAEIYAYGIASGNATFETKVPSWAQWQAVRGHLPSLVARELDGEARLESVVPRDARALDRPASGVPRDARELDGEATRELDGEATRQLDGEATRQLDGEASKTVGWAALSPVSTRDVYRGVAAISIYVDPAHVRKGVGKALLLGLIGASEQQGIWTLEAGIFPENAASIALHESCGFRLVGVRKKVGQMQDGSWRDVLLHERRSELSCFSSKR